MGTIVYNAKGQRTRVRYANTSITTYEYDPFTFLARRIRTTRPAAGGGGSGEVLQDLTYIYDAEGKLHL